MQDHVHDTRVHLCDNAKSTLAVLSQSYPMTVYVLSIGDEPDRALMSTPR
jgi:hypothetical protein